jgi:hypothetical protein
MANVEAHKANTQHAIRVALTEAESGFMVYFGLPCGAL